MLNTILREYKEAKVKLINRFSDNEVDLAKETMLIDDGYQKAKFDRFKSEYDKLTLEIENFIKYDKQDSYHLAKINHLITKQKNMRIEISFLISNSENNILLSEKLLDDIDVDFKLGIQGLKYYYEDDVKLAKTYFQRYWDALGTIPNHYLINKCYSKILFDEGEYVQALNIMRKAIQFKPEDIELHKNLKEVYKKLGDYKGYEVESNIIYFLQ